MLPRLEAADLLGARGLALAGGVVTLLGVVFFFALAASNGWIGPVERVVLGAVASAIVFAAGVFAHARYGRLDAAVAAAGAGIAGGYATLLFAAARYDLVAGARGARTRGGDRGVAVALSLRWSSEIVAAFGLIGALSVPARRAARRRGDRHAARLRGARLPRRRRRRGLAALDGLLCRRRGERPAAPRLRRSTRASPRARRARVAAAFGLLYLATGIARQLRAGGQRLDAIAQPLRGRQRRADAASPASSSSTATRAALAFAAAGASSTGPSPRRSGGGSRARVACGGRRIGPRRRRRSRSSSTAPASSSRGRRRPRCSRGSGAAWPSTRFQLLALGYLVVALGYTLVEEASRERCSSAARTTRPGCPPCSPSPPARRSTACSLELAAAARHASRCRHCCASSWRTCMRSAPALPSARSRRRRGAGRRRRLPVAARALRAAGRRARLRVGHVAVTVLWARSRSRDGLGPPRVDSGRGGRLRLLGVTIASFTVFRRPSSGVGGWAALVLAGACAAAGCCTACSPGGRPRVRAARRCHRRPLVLRAPSSCSPAGPTATAPRSGGRVRRVAGARLEDTRPRDLLLGRGAALGLGASLLLLDAAGSSSPWASAAAALAAPDAWRPSRGSGSRRPRGGGAAATCSRSSRAPVIPRSRTTPAAGVPDPPRRRRVLARSSRSGGGSAGGRLDPGSTAAAKARAAIAGRFRRSASTPPRSRSSASSKRLDGGARPIPAGHTAVSALWGAVALVSSWRPSAATFAGPGSPGSGCSRSRSASSSCTTSSTLSSVARASRSSRSAPCCSWAGSSASGSQKRRRSGEARCA